MRDHLDAGADDGGEVPLEGLYWVRVRPATVLVAVPWWRRLAATPALPLTAALVVATVGTAAVVDALTGTSAPGDGPGVADRPPARDRPTGDLPKSPALVPGTWRLATSEIAADGVCAGEAGNVYTYDIVIEQHDNHPGIRGVDGVPGEVRDAVLLETGRLGGDRSKVTAALITFSGSFPDGEGTTTAQFDLTSDFENLTCGGTRQWSRGASGGVRPNGLGTIEGYKVEQPRAGFPAVRAGESGRGSRAAACCRGRAG